MTCRQEHGVVWKAGSVCGHLRAGSAWRPPVAVHILPGCKTQLACLTARPRPCAWLHRGRLDGCEGKVGFHERCLGIDQCCHCIHHAKAGEPCARATQTSQDLFNSLTTKPLIARACHPAQGSLTPRKLLSVLIVSVPAGMMVAPFAAALPIFVMEHISISGAPPPPIGYLVGDTAIGAIVGLAAFVTGSFYAHVIAHAAGNRLSVGHTLQTRTHKGNKAENH